MLIDETKIESEIKDLLNKGMTLDEALRKMHFERGVGIMLLWKPLAKINSLSKKEAKRHLIELIFK